MFFYKIGDHVLFVHVVVDKVLGIIYNANDVTNGYKTKFSDVTDFCTLQRIPKPVGWTKRLILKCSATVYNPLGFICAFTV